MELTDKSLPPPDDMPPQHWERLLDPADRANLVRGIAQRFHLQPADAEDLLSEICLKNFDANLLAGKPPDCSKLAWLWGIVRNYTYNYFRSENRRRRRHIRTWQPDAGLVASPLDQALAEETRQAVRDCLQGLTDDERRLLELKFYDELTEPEIAEQERKPLNSVRGKLHRARCKLRDCLAGKSQEEL